MLALLSLGCYARHWKHHGASQALNAPPIYLNCMLAQYEYTRIIALMQEWPVIKDYAALPYNCIRSVFTSLTHLNHPLLRDELRKPAYKPMLQTFAAEMLPSWDPFPCTFTSILCVFKAGLPATIRRYHEAMLVFWTMRVRAKIRHWRQAHTFAPIAPFKGSEALITLIHRNPRRVPEADAVFRQTLRDEECALPADYEHLLKRWVHHCDISSSVVNYCIRTAAWHFTISNIVPQLITTQENGTDGNRPSHFLGRLYNAIGNCLATVPVSQHPYLRLAILDILNDSTHEGRISNILYLLRLYRLVCWKDLHVDALLETHWISETLESRPAVAEAVVRGFITRRRCLEYMEHRRDYWAQVLCATEAMQRMRDRIHAEAGRRIGEFMLVVKERLAQNKAWRCAAVEAHRHAWETLVVRWRWMRRPWGTCAICMESGRLVTLHGDRRHVICRECRNRVDQCPLCRKPLVGFGDDQTADLDEGYELESIESNDTEFYEHYMYPVSSGEFL